MKTKILLLCVTPALVASFVTAGQIGSDCRFKGKLLKGKVKIVDNFADFKVKIVKNFEDIKVKKTTMTPQKCGEWKIVDNFADFKIKIVKNHPDFKIKYVDNFPGVN